MLGNDIQHSNILICSDSQSALKAISGYKIQSSVILNCREKLQSLAENNSVKLVWVPGHSNIQGNEMADSLAKAGAEKSFKEHWNSIQHSRQAKNCISFNNKNSRYFTSLSRNNCMRVASVLTGHCFLNKHMHTLGLTSNDLCSNCGDVETAEHFLCKCPAYITARDKSFGAYILPYNIIWSIPPQCILDYLNRTATIRKFGSL